MNSILIPQCDHVPLAFLIVPLFLLFCVFFHPPLQTVSVHDVDPDLEAHLKKTHYIIKEKFTPHKFMSVLTISLHQTPNSTVL